MVFHFHGGGRNWGPDPRLVTIRRRWAMFQREETWSMDDVAMWQKVGIPDLGLLLSL